MIDGSAGTGKTLVAISLLHYLKTHEHFKGKKIALVYAQTAMRDKIKSVAKHFNGLLAKDIISPAKVTREKYDIVICDEAQRLRRRVGYNKNNISIVKTNERMGYDKDTDELEWLLRNTQYQVLFYDSKQNVAPTDIDTDSFEERIGKTSQEVRHSVRHVKLEEQMRIRAGDKFVPYIYNVLWQKTRRRISFKNYEFKLFDSFSEMEAAIHEKEKSAGLSRLSGGYAWEWLTKNKDEKSDMNFDGIYVTWNSQTAGWIDNPDKKNEMGSIYTLGGMDLNYVGVAIGPDLVFNPDSKKVEVNRNEIYDHEIRMGKDVDEVLKYVINSYAVLLTRGIMGTFVYAHDKGLREYLRKFI
ncbi:MAG: DUF2075 domain-containing protein [Defluviitaleaceae bacterium]|nr:DUF2075 domain-containing protein [Defluviitaleaceae bacterium]